MSIINDALKKLQNQISHSQSGSTHDGQTATLTNARQAGFEPVGSPSPSPITPSSQTKRVKGNESRLVLILGLLCLLTALFAPIVNKQSVITMLWTKIPRQNKTIVIQDTPAPSPVTTQIETPVVTTAPRTEQKQEPIREIVKNLTAPVSKAQNNTPSRLIINGIMSNADKNLALIDGQVYEEGDEVDGVKILKITPKGVTVLENGSERVVKVVGQ